MSVQYQIQVQHWVLSDSHADTGAVRQCVTLQPCRKRLVLMRRWYCAAAYSGLAICGSGWG